MATGTKSFSRTKVVEGQPNVEAVAPVSLIDNWINACEAPETADNSGSVVVAPLAITRDTQFWVKNYGIGTTVQIRLRYDDGISGSITSPVVQPFGKDGNGLPQRLVDKDGNHELTLTISQANDVQDGTYGYTAPVEVDMDANAEILIAVKTAFAATGTVNTSMIQVRAK